MWVTRIFYSWVSRLRSQHKLYRSSFVWPNIGRCFWFSGINIFKKTSERGPPAYSWGKHLPDHQVLPRSSAGAWLTQGSSAVLQFCLFPLETSDFLPGFWESETQGNSLLLGFSWRQSKLCLMPLKTHHQQFSIYRNWVFSSHKAFLLQLGLPVLRGMLSALCIYFFVKL